ncbi:leucine-rich repeat protein 1-like [Lolium rigidum]|uniref:leucine-rich repeat protein 1-like n=1 Tax=Lolium rigidum TaxID=89674 RepID=UPI001F5E2265|nr:leucine-rich repeat protein 1-like [Lolium rigidum]
MARAVAGALAIVLVAAVASTLAVADPSPDAVALQAFRIGLQDPGGELQSWDPELAYKELSGPLSPELAKLDQLQHMMLYQNRLTGPIPMELTGLSKLQVLDLSNNDLCGTIPTSGAFQNLPRSSFAGNPRLRIPGQQQGSDC